jgi:hypothetical protein
MLPLAANAALVFEETWIGSDGALGISAEAVVRYYDDNTLTITLSNTSGVLSNEPAELLTGLFWDYTGGATLTAVSAFGSYLGNSDSSIIVQSYNVEAWPTAISGGTNNGTAAGYNGDLGTEFGHVENTTMTMTGAYSGFSANYGVSSSGLGFFGPEDRYQTGEVSSVLSNPDSPDGLDMGLVSTNFTNGAGNGGMDSQPLLRGEVTFAYSVDGELSAGDITGVFFHYGTGTGEPTVGGECLNCPDPETPVVPIPPAAGLAGLGLLMVVGQKVRKNN